MSDHVRQLLAYIDQHLRPTYERENHGLPAEGFESPIRLAPRRTKFRPGGTQYKQTGAAR